MEIEGIFSLSTFQQLVSPRCITFCSNLGNLVSTSSTDVMSVRNNDQTFCLELIQLLYVDLIKTSKIELLFLLVGYKINKVFTLKLNIIPNTKYSSIVIYVWLSRNSKNRLSLCKLFVFSLIDIWIDNVFDSRPSVVTEGP